MDYKRFAVSSAVIFSTVFIQPCLAGGVSVPLGALSLYADATPDATPDSSVFPPTRSTGAGAGYGIGLRYTYPKSFSGGVELRRHDYFVDDNLKGERPRNSVMFTLGLHF